MSTRMTRTPKGLILASSLLGVATLLSAISVVSGRFVVDAKNNALIYGGGYLMGAPLGYSPFGWKTLPWLIADLVVPLAATILTLHAYRRFVARSSRFKAIGLIAVAIALIATVLLFLAAAWMFAAAAGGMSDNAIPSSPPNAWYVATANGCAGGFALAFVVTLVAAVVSLISVLRHRVEPPPIVGSRDRFIVPDN
jgi:hypothetical protein